MIYFNGEFMNKHTELYTSFFENNKQYSSFFKELKQSLEEAIKWKYVVRDGKRVKKPISDREGMRIEYSDSGTPREVRMTGTQQTTLSRQNKKTAKKTAGKRKATQKKIARSTKKHSW